MHSSDDTMTRTEIAAALYAGVAQRDARERQRCEDAITAIIKDVCERPDYTSPDDKPDLLQCTVDELTLILRRHLLGEE